MIRFCFFKLLRKISPQGFTLVELLVAIGIMAILTSGIVVLINPAAQRNRGNDGRRKADLLKIASSLEIYRADTNNYPGAGVGYPSIIASAMVPQYTSQIPTDVKNGNSCTGPYILSVPASGNGQRYTLFARLENTTDPDATKVKPAPVDISIGSTSNGYQSFTLNTFCPGVTFNYWINNP